MAEWSGLGCLLTPSRISTGLLYTEELARTVGTASQVACSQLAGCWWLLTATLSSSSCGLLHVAAPCPCNLAACCPSGEGSRRPRRKLQCWLGLSLGTHTHSFCYILWATQVSPDFV